MAIERTFSIIKPDATARNLTGAINAMIEQAGLRIVAQKRIKMSREQAETFYAVHHERPFFRELVDFMTSGPVVVQVLEGENAVAAYRDIMGATDPAKAAPGTIRKVHAKSIGENSVHGSDAPETAVKRNCAVFCRQRNRRLRRRAVTLIAEYFNPVLWRDWFNAGINEFGHTAFWFAVVQIIFINALLSGDNAIVIAMACRGLPQQQRRWGLILGAGLAVLLRIVFTVVLASLMMLPYLKLVGGAALLYISAKLLVPEGSDKSEVEAAAHLWRAVLLVVIADIVMSFDNVVAIAAAARGDFFLLAIGLAISIPFLVVGAALVAVLLDRFPILIWAGAALLGWIGGQTMATDPRILRAFRRARRDCGATGRIRGVRFRCRAGNRGWRIMACGGGNRMRAGDPTKQTHGPDRTLHR